MGGLYNSVYSVFDKVKSFDGEIEAGFYYIDTDNFFQYKRAGWYDADFVYYTYPCKIIKRIIYYYNINQVLF